MRGRALHGTMRIREGVAGKPCLCGFPTCLRASARAEAVPAVFDSPRSGHRYPENLGDAVDALLLHGAEDDYVDELHAAVPEHGATVIHPLVPRSYIDSNRGKHEIDQGMLDAPWPWPLSASAKTALGRSLIWKLYAPGNLMCARRLPAAEVKCHIVHYNRAYRREMYTEYDALHARCSPSRSRGWPVGARRPCRLQLGNTRWGDQWEQSSHCRAR